MRSVPLRDQTRWSQGPVLLEVEAHDVLDDPVTFVALQVELQGAAVEHGQVALVHAAPVRQREAAQRVGSGVVVEVRVEQVPGLAVLARRNDASVDPVGVAGSTRRSTRMWKASPVAQLPLAFPGVAQERFEGLQSLRGLRRLFAQCADAAVSVLERTWSHSTRGLRPAGPVASSSVSWYLSGPSKAQRRPILRRTPVW